MNFQSVRESTRPVGAKGYWPVLDFCRTKHGYFATSCNWAFSAPTEEEVRQKVKDYFLEYNRPKPINHEHFEKMMRTLETGVCQFCGQPHPAALSANGEGGKHG